MAILFPPNENVRVWFPVAKYREVHFGFVQCRKCTEKSILFLLYVSKYPNSLKPHIRIGRNELLRHATEKKRRIMIWPRFCSVGAHLLRLFNEGSGPSFHVQ